MPAANAFGNERIIIAQTNYPESASGNWWGLFGVKDGLYFYAAGGGSYTTMTSAVFAWTANQWYHVAVCRSGTDTRIFVNGTQSGATTTINKTLCADNVRPLTIGADVGGNAQAMNGYIDDLRFTKGVARYTGAFSVPTAAFPDSAIPQRLAQLNQPLLLNPATRFYNRIRYQGL